MTPCYECKYVITGSSANKGLFRQEGIGSIRRFSSELRSEEDLRREFQENAIAAFNEVTQRQASPKYVDVVDLKVELGEIEVIDENTKRAIEPLPWKTTADS